MNPFPVELIDGVWHVMAGEELVPCSSKAHAELLSQIPIQFELMRDNAPHHPPDRTLIESIIQLGDTYHHINTMREFQHMKTWLTKRVA